jgi:hypothetical protein
MINISFGWKRFHSYEIITRGGRKWIGPAGRKADQINPLEIKSEKKPLYQQFAELDGTDDSCLQFAHYWGLLRTESPTASEMLENWRDEIKTMSSAIAFLGGDEPPKKPGGAFKMTSLDILLVPRPGANIQFGMVLQPRNLIEAMKLQLATGVSEGSLRICKQCGTWFETGARDTRRSIAIFCGEACKNRFHYLERAKR